MVIRGTRTGTLTNNDGNYSIRADVGQVLQYRLLGNAPEERTVGAEDVINVQLRDDIHRPELSATLGQYRLGRIIGRGSMGRRDAIPALPGAERGRRRGAPASSSPPTNSTTCASVTVYW